MPLATASRIDVLGVERRFAPLESPEPKPQHPSISIMKPKTPIKSEKAGTYSPGYAVSSTVHRKQISRTWLYDRKIISADQKINAKFGTLS
ncbi:hypothetical protein BS47DRAFT_530633 [Hydnum rufescens UP504]|uniref:Uncharacterized protein n=1 Tax=Hydnum rufescens UP504 TaxID=1448309 RepID=A0A9P6B4L4_9AGAM|nr:hypothetical protein BS47DRAFT_530633 [Hydnum rufescens UP504]